MCACRTSACIIQSSIFSIFAGRRDIQALHVKCSNAERNCEWEGTVDMLEKHVAVCEFALVPCPKKCKDDGGKVKHFLKKNIDDHARRDCPNRDYACKHCGKKSTYAEITQVHDKECHLKLVNCPNECSATIFLQSDIREHVKNKCKHTVVHCKFQNIGCNREMKRGKMVAHEDDDKFHLHMALNTVVRLQDAYAALQNANSGDDIGRTVAKLKEGSDDKLEVKSCSLMKGEYITFTVSDYEAKKANNEIFIRAPFYTHPNGYHMSIRVYVNALATGKGTHVSVSAPIVKGKFDAFLKWPLVAKVTFTLLNQLEDKNHYTKTVPFDAVQNARVGKMLGNVLYIPHSALTHDPVKNTEYLKDDTLYFRVSVEVTGHKPWLECSTK